VRTAEGVRLIEPYIHGFGAQDAELLLGYQLEGPSRSGTPVGWKTIRVASTDGIERIGVTSLRANAEYTGEARGFLAIHCQV
jgi:hypothetical protein